MRAIFQWKQVELPMQLHVINADGLEKKDWTPHITLFYTETSGGWWVKTQYSKEFVEVHDPYHEWKIEKSTVRNCSSQNIRMVAVKAYRGWIVINREQRDGVIQMVRTLPLSVINEQ